MNRFVMAALPFFFIPCPLPLLPVQIPTPSLRSHRPCSPPVHSYKPLEWMTCSILFHRGDRCTHINDSKQEGPKIYEMAKIRAIGFLNWNGPLCGHAYREDRTIPPSTPEVDLGSISTRVGTFQSVSDRCPWGRIDEKSEGMSVDVHNGWMRIGNAL